MAIDIALGLEVPLCAWRLEVVNRRSDSVELDEVELLAAGPRIVRKSLRGKKKEKVASGSVRVHVDPGDLTFFSNGWQSWSFAGNVPADGRMPHTRLGPFLGPGHENPTTRVPSERGIAVSDMFGVLGDRRHKVGLLMGFLSQRQAFGSVQAWMNRFAPTLRAWESSDGIRLERGASFVSDWACLQFLDLEEREPLALYLDAVAAENDARSSGAVPAGWCSWYQYFDKVTEADLTKNLAWLAEHRDQVPLELVQLDDGFQAEVGDWFETNAKFPDGLAEVQRKIRARGFRPGLWLAPFIAKPKARLLKEHPGWMQRRPNGSPASAGFVWNTFTRGLDVTHPEVQDHVRRLIQTAVKEWGFTYLKLDFLYAAALPGARTDPTKTRAQALYSALRLVREAAGESATLVGCGCPLGSGIGVFDAMRIGTDVTPQWDPTYFGTRLFIREEPSFPSTRNAIRNTLSRMPFHRRWWVNDPDCALLRDADTRLSPDEVRTLATIIAMSGGSLLISDEMAAVAPERLEWLARLLPPLEGRGRVVDWMEPGGPSVVVFDLENESGPWSLVALVNLADDAVEKAVDTAQLGLPTSEAFLWADLWKERAGVSHQPVWGAGTIPAHGVAFLAVRPRRGRRASWVGDTLHVSQGLAVRRWRSAQDEVEASVGLGRLRQGAAWVWLPTNEVRAEMDGHPIEAIPEGDGIFRLNVRLKELSELRLRW